MKNSIHEYYDQLAESYEENRFGNSYGRYIDEQENVFLHSFFKDKNYSKVLDLGCGTGRLLKFASHGTDFSEKMLRIAKEKNPGKLTAVGEISKIPFDVVFDCIFCFHVIMHQTKEETIKFLDECFQKLDHHGILIFDYPTKTRRKTVSPQQDWHAGNTFTASEISIVSGEKWIIRNTTGILLFPVHRLPKSIRKLFLPLDILLCRTFLKKWASYHIVVLEKK
ncbi:SAM-dependent methyltransferase [Chryseobacterium shigense]|uniref:Ubiquinone/menaquinone biosynthesis C-methylase UbiE n=1 Tax=Chryseobacterium shigense TaxID=297244 RepID=A0A1N7IS14_9FLAO|nr:class I SAM-dependent methyltransferase [Chryseobacterium shigense]PQA95542.1 SAM-dependent methyltransferase [Chryseobacterium shigense]SIS39883.1 Ubiquinone/menaquinone biosynthesis C-methylase UbiE [Chryseobacterium shigense]